MLSCVKRDVYMKLNEMNYIFVGLNYRFELERPDTDIFQLSVIYECALLTIVQPICGPRSLKYMVAVVPTGRFCKMSSSLSDLSSIRTKGRRTKQNVYVMYTNSTLSENIFIWNDHIDRITNNNHIEINYYEVHLRSCVA